MQSDFLADLDEQQLRAVTHTESSCLVFAGAGSGKTRVLTYKVAHLINRMGVSPWQILCVTFTNKAAGEMRDRIKKLIGELSGEIWMGTFHSLCARILRIHGSTIGIDRDFLIFDQSDQRALIKRIMKDLDIDSEQFPIASIHTIISDAKSDLVGSAGLRERASNPLEHHAANVYARYDVSLRESRAVDFDDLLMLVVKLLRENIDVGDSYQGRFRYVLVDEYQDVNRAQHELIKLWSGVHQNLTVVGDDDQAIFGWRGADVRLMMEFERLFPDGKTFVLDRNYRSTQMIVDVASHVIGRNEHRKSKEIWTQRAQGEPMALYRAVNENQEALFVANMVHEITSSKRSRFEDIAVMFRTNGQSRVLEETFVSMGIPHRVVGALRFYERREVKDILAYLRLSANPRDMVSLERIINVPRRGIGARTLQRLREHGEVNGRSLTDIIERVGIDEHALDDILPNRALAAVREFSSMLAELRMRISELNLLELATFIIERTGYYEMLKAVGGREAQERRENVEQLVIGTGRWFGDLPASEALLPFLEQTALVTGQDEADWVGNAVTLLTCHSSKGLEFPVVFVVGLEEGLLPHYRSIDSGDVYELEEERRLFYVALTRAQDRVFLTHALKRTTFGGVHYTSSSRFLSDVPQSLVREWLGVPTTAGFSHTQPRSVESAVGTYSPIENSSPDTDLLQLNVGDRINHSVFGDGTVCEVLQAGRLLIVAFDELSVGTKTLALEFAEVKKIDEQ